MEDGKWPEETNIEQSTLTSERRTLNFESGGYVQDSPMSRIEVVPMGFMTHMIHLQIHSQFNMVAVYDPVLGTYSLQEKKDKHQKLVGSISGWAEIVNNKLICIFKYDGRLWLGIMGKHFELTHEVQSELKASEGRRWFCIRRQDEAIYEYCYELERIPALVRLMTAWDEEDEDFMLFVHKMISDKERQAGLLKVMQ